VWMYAIIERALNADADAERPVRTTSGFRR
jgi:hypothetical protein